MLLFIIIITLVIIFSINTCHFSKIISLIIFIIIIIFIICIINIIINTSTFILDNIINLFGSFLSPLSFLFKYYILSFILYFWGFFFYMEDNNENRATAACFVLSLPHFYFRSKLEILYRYWYYNFIACKFLARNSPLYCVRGENKLTCLRTYQRVKRSWTICNCLSFFLNPFFCN